MATTTAAKRARAADESESPGVTQDDLESFAAKVRGDVKDIVNESVGSAMHQHAQKQVAATIELVKKQEQKTEKRFNVVEQDLANLHRDHSALERSQEVQRAAITELQKALAVAESAIPIKDKLDLTEFERQVDSTILRINTGGIVTKHEVTRVLTPWLTDADCGTTDKAEIYGADAGRRFTIQFKGNAGYAQRNLNKARSLLKDQSGVWRQFPEPTLAAGATKTKVYVDIDKNACQLKREGDGKRLRDSLKHLYGSKHFHFHLVQLQRRSHCDP